MNDMVLAAGRKLPACLAVAMFDVDPLQIPAHSRDLIMHQA